MYNLALTRRELLRRAYLAIAASGASSFISVDDLFAAEKRRNKPQVLWLHGTSCSGCSVSFLNVEEMPVTQILTQFVDLIFHPDLSAATGHQVIEILQKVGAGGVRPYVVVEGGVPIEQPHTCIVGGRPFADWMQDILPHSAGVIAAGTCATFGGVTAMPASPTPSKTVLDFVRDAAIDRPLVALPGCPMKPEPFIYTVLHLAKLGRPPALDDAHRPLKFYADTVHDHCVYYSDFQEDRFARFIGDDGCLLHLGCQGPVSYNDCHLSGHNGNTNSCIKAGHPCIGCASEHFPRPVLLRRRSKKGSAT